jgi:hypothetical protein
LVVALQSAGIAASSPASLQIDSSQADARLIGLPIYTADGVLIKSAASNAMTHQGFT